MAKKKKTAEVESTPDVEISTEDTQPIEPETPKARVTWRSWGAWASPTTGGPRVLLSPDVTYEIVEEVQAMITLRIPDTDELVTLRRGMVERV